MSVLPLRNGDNSKTLRLHSLQWTQWSISNKNAFSVLNFDITTSYSELPYHEEFDHLLVMKEKLKIAMASDLPVG